MGSTVELGCVARRKRLACPDDHFPLQRRADRPPAVADVLVTRPERAGAGLVEGHFEKITEMPGRGRASQTDLLPNYETSAGRLVIGVEGKVDETCESTSDSDPD